MSVKMAKKVDLEFMSEDLVYRKSKDGKCHVGLVVTAGGESDSEDESDDISRRTKIPAGQIKLAWYPSGRHEVISAEKVSLLDRSLLPGDVVRFHDRSVSDQLGYIRDTNSRLTVKVLGSNQVIEDVSPNDLEDVKPLASDHLCLLKNWVGFVTEIGYDVVLSTDDGGVLHIDDLDFETLLDDDPEDDDEAFEKTPYVGQVIITRKRLIRHGVWTKQTKTTEKLQDPEVPGGREVRLTVTGVVANRAEVRWLLQTSETGHESQPPASEVYCQNLLKEFKQIDCFSKNSYQTGDRAYYVIKEDDVLTSFDDWQYQVKESDSESESTPETSNSEKPSVSSFHRRRKKLSVPVNKIRGMKLKAAKKLKVPEVVASPGTRVAVEVVTTETLSSVVWQNGNVEENVSSLSLLPVLHVDTHEYFPGDFVVENKQDFAMNYGVVQTVDHSGRTVCVKWMQMEGNTVTEKETEAVSVYDLKDHPDYQFRPGSCVVRLSDFSDCLLADKRIGQVKALNTSGLLECIWADGSTDKVPPHSLLFVGDYDDEDLWADSLGAEYDEGSLMDVDDDGDDHGPHSHQERLDLLMAAVNDLESWLTSNDTVNTKNRSQSLKMVMKLCKALKDSRIQTSIVELNHLQQLIDNSQPASFSPQDVWSRVARGISSLVTKSSGKSDVGSTPVATPVSLTSASSSSMASESPISKRTSLGLETLRKIKTQLFPVCGAESAKIEEQSSPVKEDAVASDFTSSGGEGDKEEKISDNMKMIESVPNCHRFKLSVLHPNRVKEFMARVRYEMKILTGSLPSDIIVKTFEDRMDLLSVMIKGPEKTPYEDGLFLFDVQMPKDYPQVPPVVHYLSFCRDRLNPNLYECGKVCVSLLGTWTGRGSEVWSPVSSNLLQVLVSIQGLILVPEPYFNEAGYMNQKASLEGQENSRLYNEMAVVKVVQSMTQMISNPPETFAEEMKQHVAKTAFKFIDRHKEWISCSEKFMSDPDPEKKEKLSTSTDFPLLPASKGFCLSLKKALIEFEKIVSQKM